MFKERQDTIYVSKKYIIQRYWGLLPNDEWCRGMWAVWSTSRPDLLDWSPYRNDLIARWSKKE